MDSSSSWYEDPSSLVDELRASCHSEAGVLRISGYERLCEIAGGGQGVVYSAVQQSTHQRVAIKVLLEGAFASSANRRRFEREIELVATLRHPNIVRIYDSGTTDDGRLYSVMEYIDGKPLDDFLCECEASGQRPSVRELLGLFVKVCDAVHHANQRGVVHRDLKPRNIRIDPSGEPHVLDFGLARDARPSTGLHSVTETGQFVGSLPWASPEQTDGFPDGIDVRTDVYSLGVILYRMLTGAFPYRVIGPIRDVLNNIGTKVPKRPSTIDPKINHELETIVLKCLAKAPERRYQSAGELAADVRRYLAGEPIMAKRDSMTYLLRKGLRRYRWPLAASGCFVLVLIASSIVAWSLYVESERRGDELLRRAYVDQIRLARGEYELNNMQAMRLRLRGCSQEYRGWEWDYLSYVSDRAAMTLRGHSDRVRCVAFSEDGSRIVSGSGDGTLRLWDARSGQTLHTLRGHAGYTCAAAFAPDGSWLVSVGQDGTLRIWDVETGQELRRLESRSGPVGAVAVSPGGDRIISVNMSDTVQVWDATNGELLETLPGDGVRADSVAISPDGTRFATAGMDLIRIWDLESLREIRRIECAQSAEEYQSRFVTYCGDSNHIVEGGPEGGLTIWNATTGERLRRLECRVDAVRGVACSPDGRWVASAGADGMIRVWDRAHPEEMWALRGHSDAALSVAFSSDGRSIVSGGEDHVVRLWDSPVVERGRDPFDGPMFAVKSKVVTRTRILSRPNHRMFILGGETVETWGLSEGKIQGLLSVASARGLAVSPDGAYMAVGTGWKNDRADTGSGNVVQFSTETGRQIWSTDIVPTGVKAIAFSPDGKLLAAGAINEDSHDSGRYGFDLLDARNGEWVESFRGHDDEVLSLAFDGSGTRIASAGADQSVRVWSIANAEPLMILSGHRGGVNSVAFSPDDSRIVSASDDGLAILWDAAGGERLGEFRGHDKAVLSCVFHPGGRRVASSGRDGSIRIWDVETREELLVFRTGGTIPSVAYTPDGSCLVSAHLEEKMIRVWETARPSSEVMRSRGLQADARRIVNGLMDELGAPQDVLAVLEDEGNKHSLDTEVRGAAIRLAQILSKDASGLHLSAWQIVEAQRRDSAAYQRALRMARAACDLAPANIVFRHTLGVAQYRAGLFEEARETLQDTCRLRGKPNDHSFLAMALFRLGRFDESRNELAQAQATVRRPEFKAKAHLHRFVDEAETLVSSHAPATALQDGED